MNIFVVSTLIALLVSGEVGLAAANSDVDKTDNVDTATKDGNLRRQTWSAYTNTDCGTAKCPRGYICDTLSSGGNPMCIPCGHFGEPCCDDEDSKCAYHGLFCDLNTMPSGGLTTTMSGSCQKCGRPGGPCCEGNYCSGIGTICDYYDRTDDGFPQCTTCGGPGERCCYDDGHLQCAGGLVCDQTSEPIITPARGPCRGESEIRYVPANDLIAGRATINLIEAFATTPDNCYLAPVDGPESIMAFEQAKTEALGGSYADNGGPVDWFADGQPAAFFPYWAWVGAFTVDRPFIDANPLKYQFWFNLDSTAVPTDLLLWRNTDPNNGANSGAMTPYTERLASSYPDQGGRLVDTLGIVDDPNQAQQQLPAALYKCCLPPPPTCKDNTNI